MNIAVEHRISISRRTSGCIAAAAILLTGVSCAAQPETAPEPAPEQTIKVGLFLDEGCLSNGVLCWARLIERSPELELVPLTGADIRAGKLQGLRLVVCPGGGSARQLNAMKPQGVAALKQFIADGGSYLGACAGCYSVLNRPGRMAMLPYDWIDKAAGKYAALTVEFSKDGAKRLDIKPGRYTVRYHGGPVMRPAAATGKGTGETLSVFKSSAGWIDRAPYNFVNTPSTIYGTYGKGKVIATSFHPESWDGTHFIALGCIYAVTGVKPHPVPPPKSWRRIRVGFCAAGGPVTPRTVATMLALDRHPELDVLFVSGQEVLEGILDHVDVLFVPEGRRESYQSIFKNPLWSEGIRKFLDRGGSIVAVGNGAKFLPAHANLKVLKAGDDPIATLLKKP